MVIKLELKADLHIHSVASGHAYSTIGEIAAAAKERGLQMVAITDHGPAMPGAPHHYHFGNLRVLPAEIGGVMVLKGVEANIINDKGDLDLDKYYLERLDIVLAGFHTGCFKSSDMEDCTRAMLNLMENPIVDIIVHPGNPEFPLNYEAVVSKAAEKGIPLEINNSSFCGSRRGSYDNCSSIARMIAAYGGPVVIGSDAHFAADVGMFDLAVETVIAAGISEEQVLNTSVEKVVTYLRRKKTNKGDAIE
ncbi:phosphatase [Phosphitispora sp. TUW77]|uniref:phosphatase n=1 Tax=Phosphitispora sp. TUW77 TaxID=3152361 RepID=UPI003AB8CA3A